MTLFATADLDSEIAGSPTALWATSDEYAATARDLLDTSTTLGRLRTDGWSGEAARAFAVSHDGLVRRARAAAESYAAAADALGRHAAVLRAAQADAADAGAAYRRAAACTPRVGLADDRVTPAQAVALAELSDARASVARSADAAAASLAEATSRAPRAGGFWNDTGKAWSHFWRGAWDPVEGLGELAWRENQVRAVVDPEGWSRDTEALAAGVGAEVRDPERLGKDLVDWDTWSTDPARAAGRLVPEAVLALVTAGTGTVAAKGAASATVAEKAALEGAGVAAISEEASASTSALEAAAGRAPGHDGLTHAAESAPAIETETRSPTPMKPQAAMERWEEFLGPGPYTDLHPHTGLSDPDRLVSTDGLRSIRFGHHEMASKPNKLHFHEESWTFDPATGLWNVQNFVVRVPFPKGAW